MSDRTPPTETITATDARQHFASVINRVARKQSRVLIEKSGIPVAGIVSAEDLRRLDQLDEDRAERYRILEAMRAPFRDVPPEEIEREAERALADGDEFSVIDEMRVAFQDVPDEEIEREAARTIAEIRAERREGRKHGEAPRSSS